MRNRDLAKARVRFGYFRIYILLRREGWMVNQTQELTMMTKTAEVAGLGPDGERGGRSNPWNPAQELLVRALV